LGTKCFVGHGAVVLGVKLADGKFVPHGALVDTQDKADALGGVPDSLKHFNEEVVGVNNEFADEYSLQIKKCDCSCH
jgi:carbonic anhydrase/acetyltransferase-like protein (isoleucine patch superfamily)